MDRRSMQIRRMQDWSDAAANSHSQRWRFTHVRLGKGGAQ